jgi:acetoin:2,6-dichlorophenolindophenol oxidoreductase subunit alpha
MAVEVKIPDMGTTVDYVTIEKWRVKVGDRVKRGGILADVQTDKAVAELESVAEGVVLELRAGEGENVNIGDTVAVIGQPEERVALQNRPPEKAAQRASTTPPPAEKAGSIQVEPAATPRTSDEKGSAAARRPAVSMVVRNLARNLDVDLNTVQGSGPGGRITREDVIKAAKGEAPAAAAEDKQDKAFLLGLYRKMVLIRHFEERVKFLFLEGKMPGTIHQYIGQEAIAVGVCANLNQDDIITSTHRSHGHALAKGLTAESLLHELFGKKTGCCRGKGGSMHLGDLDKGMPPAIAIVGGNVPLATGAALAFKMRGESRVAVSFTGDGGVNEGAFHEAVNMGAVWSLPVVYVVENNLYAASTPLKEAFAIEKLSDRAAAYGIPGVTIDGNDVLEVYRTAREAIARARGGQGPTLIDALTYRITGHSRRDPCNYQPEEERKKALEREPIKRFASYLADKGIATQAELGRIGEEVDAEIEAGVESAMKGEDPKPEDALEDLFV